MYHKNIFRSSFISLCFFVRIASLCNRKSFVLAVQLPYALPNFLILLETKVSN